MTAALFRHARALAFVASLVAFTCAAFGQPSVSDLPHFHQHSVELATAGQPTRAQLAAVKVSGYVLVINLSPTGLPGEVKDEQQLVEASGVSYVRIPVDWDKPSPEGLEKFFDVMDRYKGSKVMVHCWLNARSSAFVYAYRTMKLGLPEAEEREILTSIWDKNEGYELRNAPQWQAFLDQARIRFKK